MTQVIPKRRRLEGITDYQARRNMLKSGRARVVFRKTNKYIIGQVIVSEEAADRVIESVTSKELLGKGWPENKEGSLKSLPAAYLTGLMLGKNSQTKKITSAILDIGLNRNIAKSRIYAFANGIVDSGLEMPVSEKMFPEKARIDGEQIKMSKEIKTIKEKIQSSDGTRAPKAKETKTKNKSEAKK
ncbi:MAG: 50S ribosomal protein L18 [Nanoarchaeota archaeon]